MIVCDGLPALLGWNLIFNTYFCQQCQSSFEDFLLLKTHNTEFHKKDTIKSTDLLEFDWIILRLGYGHYLMNSLKTIIDFCWEIFFKDLATCVGYKSVKALLYCKNASDTHKSMELVRLAYKAGLDELMLPFVRHCRAKLITPCFEAYFTWRNVYAVDSNYNLMADIVFEYLHSMILLKSGIRQNNSTYLNKARATISSLFCSRNKKNYIFLDTLNNINKNLIPVEIQNFIEKNETILCKDGKNNEAFDFIVEQINKKIKFWLPIGVPSPHHWIKVVRNYQKLEKVCKKV